MTQFGAMPMQPSQITLSSAETVQYLLITAALLTHDYDIQPTNLIGKENNYQFLS
jgi:hypothetical protein